MAHVLRAVCLALATLAAPGCGQQAAPESKPPAAAEAPAELSGNTYAGTWAVDLAQCRALQEDQNAPMIMTEAGYDQHEAHCAFDTITPVAAGVWDVEAVCVVEGDQQSASMRLSVAGDKLTIESGAAAMTRGRCP